jgi:hypothetical protein
MDPVAARRTSAGTPVVHGIHTLVWAIDHICQAVRAGQISRIKAEWSQFVHVGEVALLRMEPKTGSRVRAQICVGREPVALLTVFFSSEPPADCLISELTTPIVTSPQVPTNLGLDALPGQFGAVGFVTSPAQVASRFPFAAHSLGKRSIAGLLNLSRLVGMICPGLHSILARLDVAVSDADATDSVSYKVISVDERFRYVTQDVHGAGLSGMLEALVRNPPAEQPGIDELSRSVAPAEFRGSVALVIGGSRGLGEVTAKLLAAGGAHVIISYSIGQADADRVASSIRAAGGTCEIIHYDASNTSVDQLGCLGSLPTHVYYFATGPISHSRTKPFDSTRFEESCAFYVAGFAHLCSCLRPPARTTVRVFYPSSVYVSAEHRPRGFAEYAMAKTAGEILCAEITSSCPQIEVVSRRLPRMLTDQTAGSLPEQPLTPADAVMLDAIREMHAPAPRRDTV